MKYVIEVVARDVKKARNGEPYTGVKIVDLGWVNVMGDHSDKGKGDIIHLTEPRTLGNGKQLWAYVDKSAPKEEAPHIPARSCCNGPEKPTLADWDRFVTLAHKTAKILEPNDPQARAALINTAVIAWSNKSIDFCSGEESDAWWGGFTDPNDEVPF